MGPVPYSLSHSSRILDMDFLHFLAFLFVLLLSRTGATGTLRSSLDPQLEIYKKMFEIKRREQLSALKNLAQLNDVHQQYKILDVMLKGLFKMAQELGISEKDSDFQNPFKIDRTEFIPSTDPFQKALREEEKRRKKEERRKEIRKGPRISRSQSEL
ncbi:coiled-coil domain-containing protein 134 isoform X3 [Nycticebus coucang]|uniref:coiled-coil domain-containing protein 134 isoform X3 n=1 Tax=Nycticebus coucang TaxID=9470 RepID=UPI00234CCDB7|nr:coiled-coil domain-containing protein 134 isoform X3 [Nycticebus coucang]